MPTDHEPGDRQPGDHEPGEAAAALSSAVLGLELGVAGDLLRRGQIVDAASRATLTALSARPQRTGLILAAADTVYPDLSVCSLPGIARAEVVAGLSGVLRTTFAATSDDLSNRDQLEWLTELLLVEVAGARSGAAALDIALRVHLGRAARGNVPVAIGFACLSYYTNYAAMFPSHPVFGQAVALVGHWVQADGPSVASIELRMLKIAEATVGADPIDPLDLAV